MKNTLTGRLVAYVLAFASLLSLAMPAQAQLSAGRDFVEVKPALQADNPAKIEVVPLKAPVRGVAP